MADASNNVSIVPVDLDEQTLRTATGAASGDLQRQLANQVLAALWLPQELGPAECSSRVQAALAALAEIRPQDGVEGMLAVQMVAIHQAAMECFRRAARPAQTFEAGEMKFRHAAKLTATYLRQLEALDKHRGKGSQTVTVKYVHVAADVQAIVGALPAGPSAKPNASHPPAAVVVVHGAVPSGEPEPSSAGRRKRALR